MPLSDSRQRWPVGSYSNKKENVRRPDYLEYRKMFEISDRMALFDLSELCHKRIGKTGRSTD